MECYCPKCELRLALGQTHKCAPAQEEKEEMVCCKSCGARIGMGIYCEPCERQVPNEKLTADLRERWDKAFFAALSGGLMACGTGESWPTIEGPVVYSANIANETTRRHSDMMAERDRIIAEVVG